MNTRKSTDQIKDVKGVSRETLDRLTVYHDLLRVWQSRINLISSSTIDQIWERHISDSLQICATVAGASKFVDIGSGAGFPGLVQAILLAEKGEGRVDLIESVGKKCAFMSAVVRETGLKTTGIMVNVHNCRIEDILSDLPHPEIITARALTSLDKLFELTEVFLSNGTIGLFPKGKDHSGEIRKAEENWTFDSEKILSEIEEQSVILKISGLKRR